SFAALTMSSAPTKAPAGTLFIGEVAAGPQQTPQKHWAVYVEGERIVAVGPADTLRATHPGAHVIDVTGSTILPGLTDAHGHLYGLGLSLDTVKLVGTGSYDEVIARVKQRVSSVPAGGWV